jgi:hypothetical protein
LLFGKDSAAQKDETTAPYETVEEGMTTDTTDVGSDQETAAVQKLHETQKTVEEGIRSSDDESQT